MKTYLGTGGRGACGVDTGYLFYYLFVRREKTLGFSNPPNSAAISGQFFDSSCPWTSGKEQQEITFIHNPRLNLYIISGSK